MLRPKYRMTEPELRSVELMQGVVESTSANILKLTHTDIKIRVQGESKRWYEIEARFDERYSGDEDGEWNTSINGSRRESDLVYATDYCASLCLHSDHQDLPIGDHIATLILSLSNDIQTSMEIPMLAQFIVAKREMLKKIMIFQDTMIVSTDMVEDSDWNGHIEHEEFSLDEDETLDFEALFEHMHPTAEGIELEDYENLDDIDAKAEELERKRMLRDQQLTSFWDAEIDKFYDRIL